MNRYLTTNKYSMLWNGNGSTMTKGLIPPSEAEAMEHANFMVAEMRSAGAASPIRSVLVRQWPEGAHLADAPPLFQASYYEAAQGLTDAEVYSARVHDWHIVGDRINRNSLGLSAGRCQPLCPSGR